jgi:hypothetical protein
MVSFVKGRFLWLSAAHDDKELRTFFGFEQLAVEQ